eukprot:358421-Chlamydomonas_euryale.AAC.10
MCDQGEACLLHALAHPPAPCSAARSRAPLTPAVLADGSHRQRSHASPPMRRCAANHRIASRCTRPRPRHQLTSAGDAVPTVGADALAAAPRIPGVVVGTQVATVLAHRILHLVRHAADCGAARRTRRSVARTQMGRHVAVGVLNRDSRLERCERRAGRGEREGGVVAGMWMARTIRAVALHGMASKKGTNQAAACPSLPPETRHAMPHALLEISSGSVVGSASAVGGSMADSSSGSSSNNGSRCSGRGRGHPSRMPRSHMPQRPRHIAPAAHRERCDVHKLCGDAGASIAADGPADCRNDVGGCAYCLTRSAVRVSAELLLYHEVLRYSSTLLACFLQEHP